MALARHHVAGEIRTAVRVSRAFHGHAGAGFTNALLTAIAVAAAAHGLAVARLTGTFEAGFDLAE